ncbi:hypothetical protein [Fischerella sp. PCC 9605]|uniref:hypothetical protein n=1 Tax=Fischerella sp. PCC 9605 TaxID=1173024 RepID=UPI00047C1A1C|nr:hypothetical protein [Fischerella sp. PCC 9605]
MSNFGLISHKVNNSQKLKIRDEHREKFEYFVYKLRLYAGLRPAATEYEFGMGCSNSEEDREKTKAELTKMLESWGFIVTSDTFKVGSCYVDVDSQLMKAKINLQQLTENSEAEKYWQSLTPEQKTSLADI